MPSIKTVGRCIQAESNLLQLTAAAASVAVPPQLLQLQQLQLRLQLCQLQTQILSPLLPLLQGGIMNCFIHGHH
jgi:hypothetical protein